MTDSNFNDVGTFHYRFGLRAVNYGGAGPNVTAGREKDEQQMLDFRIDFMHEELQEFIDASEEKDDAKMFDALIDLVYVTMGTAHLLGYPWQAGWDRVQTANMAKERATSEDMSVRRSLLDVVKPAGWMPPDIEGLLAEYGF